MVWQPNPQQLLEWEDKGYFVLRSVVNPEEAAEMRGVIKNIILTPEPEQRVEADPMDPMGDTPEARAARFRKLNRFCHTSPLIWHRVHCGAMAPLARYYLGDDILLKFSSVFVKPALTGAATPWHQDNGLWRDGETEPFNFWMALDPATRQNACLQFVPGSHAAEIVQHVLYDDSIHAELPRDRVDEMLARREVEHIELQPGDVVCWHSSLWHYSPVNTSPQGRIGMAGVYTTPDLVRRSERSWGALPWVLRGGELCAAFPPEEFDVVNGRSSEPEPHPRA
ncbi:MAG: phytanoyl-CoA dioxygenase family protein [Candidatus Latescibacterota bacterium]